MLAVALTVRAVTEGSVCLDLDRIAEIAPELPWPEPTAWRAALAGSRVVTQGALVLDHGLLYLDRYHRLEVAVGADLTERAARAAPPVDHDVLAAALDRAFPEADATDPEARDYAEQRAAAVRAAGAWTTVLTGGPGTGKTTTVAGLICAARRPGGGDGAPAVGRPGRADRQGRRPAAGVRADRGRGQPALRRRPRPAEPHRRRDAPPAPRLAARQRDRFRHDRANRLKYDVIVVDESSMVELTMMARLLEAIRADAGWCSSATPTS